LKIDCHINKIPKQVRLEVFKLNSSKSKNFVRLCKEKVNHLPRFSIDVICFLMATPTVAKPIYDKKLEKYIPYSVHIIEVLIYFNLVKILYILLLLVVGL